MKTPFQRMVILGLLIGLTGQANAIPVPTSGVETAAKIDGVAPQTVVEVFLHVPIAKADALDLNFLGERVARLGLSFDPSWRHTAEEVQLMFKGFISRSPGAESIQALKELKERYGPAIEIQFAKISFDDGTAEPRIKLEIFTPEFLKEFDGKVEGIASINRGTLFDGGVDQADDAALNPTAGSPSRCPEGMMDVCMAVMAAYANRFSGSLLADHYRREYAVGDIELSGEVGRNAQSIWQRLGNAIQSAYAQVGASFPIHWVPKVIEQESGGKQSSISSKGAIGWMQLMPETAKGLGVNPHDPYQNLVGGIKELNNCFHRFGRDPALTFACYNAGPGAVLRARGVPHYKETQAYVGALTSRL